MHLRRHTLPFRRQPSLVLKLETLEVGINVLLCEVAVLPHFLHKALNVQIIVLLSAPAFTLKLVLPACLLERIGRVGSLGRLDMCWLRYLFFWCLVERLGADKDWFDWSAGVNLDCGLGSSTH